MQYNGNFQYTPYQNDNEREKLQFHFDCCFVNGDKSSLREQYKALRKIERKIPEDFVLEAVDISSLVENITTACDVILWQMGISFVYCGNATSPVRCNQKLVTKAILNLISNAYLYGCENLVTVKTIEIENFVRIEIQSGGVFEDKLYNNGLHFVSEVCRKNGGNFFIEQSITGTKAIMILQKSLNYNNPQNVDFYTFINDRLSPVYVELFGMEYH